MANWVYPGATDNYSYLFSTFEFLSRWGLESIDYLSDNGRIPGVLVSEYSTPATEDQVLAWYQQAMTWDNGWTLEQENSSANVAVQKYMYGQTGFLLLVFPNVIPGLTCFVIATGPWSIIQSCGSDVDLSVPGPFFAPRYGNVTFTASPVNVSAIDFIGPIGNVGAPGHVIPSDHFAFTLYPGLWDVCAPANGIITGIYWGNSTLSDNFTIDYGVDIDYTSTLQTCYYHLVQIAPWIMDQINQTAFYQTNFQGKNVFGWEVNIPVTAGEVVASAASLAPLDDVNLHHGFEMATYDAAYQSHEILLGGYLGEKCTVCGLNYFEPALQDTLFSLCNRTAEPRGGVYDYDQFGKLIGNWELLNVTGEGPGYTPLMVSFSYNDLDPSIIQFCADAGTVITQNSLFWAFGNSPDPADVSPANGTVIFYLRPVTSTYTGGDCTLLVEMLGVKQVLGVSAPGLAQNVEEIQAETFQGIVSNPSFTGNATIYWRGDDTSESIRYCPVPQFNGSVDQGQTSVLSLLAWDTSDTFTYQWFEQAPGGSYVAVGTDSSSFSFVTSSSTATGSWSFLLQVTEATGDVTNSTAANVMVSPPLTVSVSPSSYTMNVSQSQTFSATVSGGSPVQSYQWYLNGTAVSGATGIMWTFTPSSAGSYTVYVKVIDAASVVATSNTATVTVLPAVSEFPAMIPLILMVSVFSALIMALTKRRKPIKA
jgi:hypothetical protein